MNHGLVPYIGGKHRLADRLVKICASTGATTFCDVFGGSAAVTLAAHTHFRKLIYTDAEKSDALVKAIADVLASSPSPKIIL